MNDLIGCLGFLWACAVIVGLVMIEFRLSKMQRMMARQLSIMEDQRKATGVATMSAVFKSPADAQSSSAEAKPSTSVRVNPPKPPTPPTARQ